jgi:deferrochelatase/peroxidase EfeB
MTKGTDHTVDPGDNGERRGSSVSRRKFLGAVGGFAGGAAVLGTGVGLSDHNPAAGSVSRSPIEPFYGVHQGGIATSPQTHAYFAALDVTTERRSELAELLKSWTSVAANVVSGRTSAPETKDPDSIEPDAGDALGLGPARLTVNFGFGPNLFGVGDEDRFGLSDDRPVWLVDLPTFRGDQLIESDTGGDLTVHACADDPQVAFHAVRQLVRAAEGVACIRWSQAGFNEANATAGTPRNLMGFKDGTSNLTTDAELKEFVWVGDEGPDWMTGGTYLVVRRIRMSLEHWDAQSLGTQENVIGRHKVSGAPLGKPNEFDALDLGAKDADGNPAIPLHSHVRIASPQENWGQMLLRRSYAYSNGAVTTPSLDGSVREPAFDAGLLFACYQRNPRLAFIPIFRRLAESDSLSKFTAHTASAIVAIPPAATHPGRWVGQKLLES